MFECIAYIIYECVYCANTCKNSIGFGLSKTSNLQKNVRHKKNIMLDIRFEANF